jgi:hypothetical protein
MRFVSFPVAVIAAGLCTGCSYDAPPQPTLVDMVDGVLPDAAGPIVVGFHEPIDFKTLKLKIIRYETDVEGNLLDESDPPGALDVIFEHSGVADSDVGGIGEIDASGTTYTINASTTPPVGPQLALVIEPGLADMEGNTWKVRKVIRFGYEFSCGDEPLPTAFPNGVHFMLAEIEAPISTQLQLLADIRVDPVSGLLVGQFTNADRDASIDCSPHGLSCADTEVCRLLPAPECVEPSRRAGDIEEYPDWTHNAVPPTGYTFTAFGCIVDQEDGSFTFANSPVDVIVQSPPVTVKGIEINASFARDSLGVLRGSGSFTAAQVLLGPTPSGSGSGSVTFRLIPPEEVKPGVPEPPVPPGSPP